MSPMAASSMHSSPKSSSGRRNKRKSHEPKRVATELASMRQKLLFEDCAATSDGEERNDSPRGSSTPDSCNRSNGSSENCATSPKEFCDYQRSLAPPKKRFRADVHFQDYYLKSDSKTAVAPPSPPTTPSPNSAAGKIHRPWDDNKNEDKVPTTEFGATAGLPFAFQSLSAKEENAKAFATVAAQQMAMSPGFLTLYKLYPQLFDVNLLSALASPSTPSPDAKKQPPKDWMPEQEEPLALIKKPTKPKVAAPPKSKEFNASKQTASASERKTSEKLQPRNYKNMTRERRVEANARERQRVHTITAAFDTLQSLIPSPESAVKPSADPHTESLKQVKDVLFECSKPSGNLNEKNQYKPSKLAIIKIATAYITLLSRLAGYDYTEDKSAPTVEDCIQNCTDLLDQELKCKRKGFAE